jgi:hypothetical protein
MITILSNTVINNSLEWNKLETILKSRAKVLTNGKDVYKMIENIKPEVTKLSIAEIEARRGRKQKSQELLIQINRDIEMIEEYLLVATLLG